MKIIFEGENLDEIKSQASRFLEETRGDGHSPEVSHREVSEGLPLDVLDFVRSKSGNHATRKHLVEMYLTRAGDLGTEFEIGTSSRTKDNLNHYLMVRDFGPRHFGAVAYVRPSTGGVTLRLPETAAKGRSHARVRNLSDKSKAYQIRLQLTNEAAVDEAIELTKLALDEVRSHS